MLVSAVLCRNEVDRYLARVLTRLLEVSDHVLLLDDNSTDDSRTIARRLGCRVRKRSGDTMWGKESSARRELWDWGTEVCGDGWLLICDADQILEGDPRPYCESWELNTWAFPLFDCWGAETTYRADGHWQAHRHPRPWLFCPSRVPKGWVAEWSGRQIHTGHHPQNWPALTGITTGLLWSHLGYVKSEHRAAKLAAYTDQMAQLTPFEAAHARSIGD